jgi:hypothetical protein
MKIKSCQLGHSKNLMLIYLQTQARGSCETPLLLAFTKDIFIDFSKEDKINLIFPPYCCICIALSIDTHMSYSDSHKAMWLYGHNSEIWPYGQMATWLLWQPIWVSIKKAIQMQQSGENIKFLFLMASYDV